ncbi:hypothetical protein DH2020_003380 [Rehmannia glutinosa]|uniref:Protein kinase domain-containing protein n=1 Tax=Rehmannia glutinosa TaxID=99300 RepID=A0ABR0XLL5_REHGL
MGNCFGSSARVDASLSTTSEASRNPSKTSNGSVPSNISIHSYSGKNSAESLPTPRSEAEILSRPNVKPFLFNELKNATRNFRPDSLLGEGGFGYVFKGWIDEHTLTAAKPGSGLVIAVKKLKPEGFQGHKEWLTEVNYLGQLRHPNLVKLIGYCSEGDNRLLVYEFMPKGSLENHLFRRGPQPLSWATRIKVAIGAARGLSFLHEAEEQVIYRDFKASNILLDGEFNAKLSDFGLAKAGPTGDRTTIDSSYGHTRICAPEYVATGRLTAKVMYTASALFCSNYCRDASHGGGFSYAEELQAPKSATKHSKTKTENQIDSVRMSPLKHHSPMNITPLASPLPAHRRASRVR